MNWTPEEIEFLVNNYPNRIFIDDICSYLKKSRRAVRHKAARLGVYRKGVLVKKLGDPTPRNLVDRKYYLNNKEKVYQRKMERRWKIKQKMVDLLGGKCSICGYNKCVNALEFHHKKDKERAVAKLLKDNSREKVLKEVKKCILLCANCHRELHFKGP